eukprot:jgi/Mesvir1/3034/Mv16441-RA.1
MIPIRTRVTEIGVIIGSWGREAIQTLGRIQISVSSIGESVKKGEVEVVHAAVDAAVEEGAGAVLDGAVDGASEAVVVVVAVVVAEAVHRQEAHAPLHLAPPQEGWRLPRPLQPPLPLVLLEPPH